MEARSVVIIEDDPDNRRVLERTFRESGFHVFAYGAGLAGVESVRANRPDVITVDLSLPDIDGFEVTRRIRLFTNAYILIVTARTQELDTVLGLEAGADDYVNKPFRPRELRYRVEALLRRPRERSDMADQTDPPQPAAEREPAVDVQEIGAGQFLEHNGLRMCLPARTVEVDGFAVKVTPTEFDLLQVILQSGRTVQSKEDLVMVIRRGQAVADGFGREADEQVIQVHVANLRRKLGETTASPRWVETVHGFGYRLAAAVPAPAKA